VTSIDPIIAVVKDDLDRVEQGLFVSLTEHRELIKNVSNYVLSSGGKRFRPLVLLLAARLCEYRGESHIPLSCVVEYIHTATLLHDDVIDHAQIRRGNSSANTLWGNHTTILVGDFLLSKAFAMAVEYGNTAILQVIARSATLMVEAETLQMEHSRDPLLSEDNYLQIITKKTATLISAAAQIGAILAGVSSTREQALADYGMNVGIAFQIMDDVLDYASTEHDLGKAIGKDLQEGSITLPFIEALQRSSVRDKKIMTELLSRGEELQPGDMAAILEIINKYEGNSRAVDKAHYYIRKAEEALQAFDGSELKKPLLALARYVVERTG
jgi:octaprenyl-diphosphate synthase